MFMTPIVVQPIDMKEGQINIQLATIASRDAPPHYPIQDTLLLKRLGQGLIHNVDKSNESDIQEKLIPTLVWRYSLNACKTTGTV
jgi:hypothetical protein